MKELHELAKQYGLSPSIRDVFVEYVRIRFPHDVKHFMATGKAGYLREWVSRFAKKKAYALSDLEGQRILQKISKKHNVLITI